MTSKVQYSVSQCYMIDPFLGSSCSLPDLDKPLYIGTLHQNIWIVKSGHICHRSFYDTGGKKLFLKIFSTCKFTFNLVPETMSQLHVRSGACMAPFHVRSKVCIGGKVGGIEFLRLTNESQFVNLRTSNERPKFLQLDHISASSKTQNKQTKIFHGCHLYIYWRHGNKHLW